MYASGEKRNLHARDHVSWLARRSLARSLESHIIESDRIVAFRQTRLNQHPRCTRATCAPTLPIRPLVFRTLVFPSVLLRIGDVRLPTLRLPPPLPLRLGVLGRVGLVWQSNAVGSMSRLALQMRFMVFLCPATSASLVSADVRPSHLVVVVVVVVQLMARRLPLRWTCCCMGDGLFRLLTATHRRVCVAVLPFFGYDRLGPLHADDLGVGLDVERLVFAQHFACAVQLARLARLPRSWSGQVLIGHPDAGLEVVRRRAF